MDNNNCEAKYHGMNTSHHSTSHSGIVSSLFQNLLNWADFPRLSRMVHSLKVLKRNSKQEWIYSVMQNMLLHGCNSRNLMWNYLRATYLIAYCLKMIVLASLITISCFLNIDSDNFMTTHLKENLILKNSWDFFVFLQEIESRKQRTLYLR